MTKKIDIITKKEFERKWIKVNLYLVKGKMRKAKKIIDELYQYLPEGRK